MEYIILTGWASTGLPEEKTADDLLRLRTEDLWDVYHSQLELGDKVARFAMEGYVLHGGPIQDPRTNNFHQAMIRTPNDKT